MARDHTQGFGKGKLEKRGVWCKRRSAPAGIFGQGEMERVVAGLGSGGRQKGRGDGALPGGGRFGRDRGTQECVFARTRRFATRAKMREMRSRTCEQREGARFPESVLRVASRCRGRPREERRVADPALPKHRSKSSARMAWRVVCRAGQGGDTDRAVAFLAGRWADCPPSSLAGGLGLVKRRASRASAWPPAGQRTKSLPSQ